MAFVPMSEYDRLLNENKDLRLQLAKAGETIDNLRSNNVKLELTIEDLKKQNEELRR
jgi:hypothetical protein